MTGYRERAIVKHFANDGSLLCDEPHLANHGSPSPLMEDPASDKSHLCDDIWSHCRYTGLNCENSSLFRSTRSLPISRSESIKTTLTSYETASRNERMKAVQSLL